MAIRSIPSGTGTSGQRLEAPKRAPSVLPSVAMAKWANPLIKALLLSPLHRVLSKDLMLITFTGRKSHRKITIPVSYYQEGEAVTLFTREVWWKNLRGSAEVTLRVRGRDLQGTAETFTDTEDVVEGVSAYIRKNGLKNVWKIRVALDAHHQPSRDELVAAAQGLVMVRVSGISGRQGGQ